MHQSSRFKYFFLLLITTVQLNAQATIYVSPTGNDSNDGQSTTNAVQTFQKGADLAKAQGATGVTVEFADGTYIFNNTVVLDATYSGITFKAASGTTPVFSSLLPVTGWSNHTGNIQVANLPAGISKIRYLQDASESWLKRSSTEFFRPDFIAPCGGSECEHWEPGAPQQRKTFTLYPSSFPTPEPSKASQYDLRAHMTAWHAQVLPISSINTSDRRINVSTPSHYSLVNGIDDLLTECWVLNTIEGIDQPGEWACIDGKIYLYPISGTADIYAPQLKELIRIDAGGDGNTWAGTPVSNITFEGITFTGTDYRISEASDITAQHDWQMVDVPEGMLRFRNAENCTVHNCTFTKGGSDAIRLDRYAQNMTIQNSHFSYLGKGGVALIGRGFSYGDVNKNNTIQGNNFIQTSQIKWDAAAVHVDQSSNNLIRQNYFSTIPLSAVIMSGGRVSNIYEMQAEPLPINRDFHFLETPQFLIDDPDQGWQHFYEYNNVVEENTFQGVHIGMPELIPAVNIDAPGFTNGMIYTTGRRGGETSYIRKNYFVDVDAFPTYSHTWIVLGDGHEDYLDIHQNMAYNLNQNNGFEDPPFLSNNCEVANGCRAFANVKLNSPYSAMECGVCQNTHYAGNIDFDNSSPAGSSNYLNEYLEMWNLLCPGNLPGPNPLPGRVQLQEAIGNKITAFGGTIPNCTTALPVELTSFSGEVQRQKTLLNWRVTSYSNLSHFEVQRSADALGFETIATVHYDKQTTYQLFDYEPLAGINYYRLKSIDADGEFSYSKIISVNFQKIRLTIYPNPAIENVIVESTNQGTLRIFNLMGKLMIEQDIKLNKQSIQMENLPNGMYQVVFYSNGKILTEKVLKIH